MLSRYVLVCASAFLVTMASATAGRGADGERLNVVLILADDKYYSSSRECKIAREIARISAN